MDLEALKAEAERLAWPGVLLREAGEGSPAAHWHDLNRGGLCLSLTREGRSLDVYMDEDEGAPRPSLTES